MSNIITTEEFAISKEIVATETETENPETRLVNEQSKANVELVDFETWLASYLDPDLTYSDPMLLNTRIMGASREECQSFFDTLRALLMAGKIKNIVTNNFRSYREVLSG